MLARAVRPRATKPARRELGTSPETLLAIVAVVLVAVLVVHVHHRHRPAGLWSPHDAIDGAALMSAMMLPLAGPSARVVAERSLRHRRVIGIGEHAAGFSALWFLFGLPAVIAVQVMAHAVAPTIVFGNLVVAAALWQLSAHRRRYVDRCSRVRVAPPSGWRADLRTSLSGTMQAASCVRSCGASMLAMAAAPHPAVMGLVLAANFSEWAPGPNPFDRTRHRRPAIAYLALAVGALFVALA